MAKIDERIGKNVARYRGDMSQRELANRVRDFGLKWTHLTVASIERGERPLRASESVLLMQLLKIPNFEALLSSEGSTRLRMLIDRAAANLERTRADFWSVMKDKRDLEREFRKLEAEGDSDSLDPDLLVALSNLTERANELTKAMEGVVGAGEEV
ncbi:hypothetical protein Q7F20_07535 [Curtobacterium sp. A7_M15]|uniref:hypothetical protein n=1 Tax=Curtobacterium sp. A7_M15 TaxID=3065241 RepID=UPI002737D33E|nr:hypothetical protein [Curtobacterium sp. A7_M15]MDP4333220.1 hypothetical protein [Curtobacterium sp. A7_M15]